VSNQKPKGLGLRIRLTRASQTYLLHDPDFFSQPIWIVLIEGKPPVKVITKKNAQHGAWKKQAPGLQGDAIELGTEAGIDILLYWNGKQSIGHRRSLEPLSRTHIRLRILGLAVYVTHVSNALRAYGLRCSAAPCPKEEAERGNAKTP